VVSDIQQIIRVLSVKTLHRKKMKNLLLRQEKNLSVNY
jgi:hypothetical protein